MSGHCAVLCMCGLRQSYIVCGLPLLAAALMPSNLGTFVNVLRGVAMQVQYERHAAQAAVAQTAKVQLRKETEWMRRQPKARSTKSKSRQDAFYTLSDVARSGPKQEVKADFGPGAMARQVSLHSFTQYVWRVDGPIMTT